MENALSFELLSISPLSSSITPHFTLPLLKSADETHFGTGWARGREAEMPLISLMWQFEFDYNLNTMRTNLKLKWVPFLYCIITAYAQVYGLWLLISIAEVIRVGNIHLTWCFSSDTMLKAHSGCITGNWRRVCSTSSFWKLFLVMNVVSWSSSRPFNRHANVERDCYRNKKRVEDSYSSALNKKTHLQASIISFFNFTPLNKGPRRQ